MDRTFHALPASSVFVTRYLLGTNGAKLECLESDADTKNKSLVREPRGKGGRIARASTEDPSHDSAVGRR